VNLVTIRIEASFIITYWSTAAASAASAVLYMPVLVRGLLYRFKASGQGKWGILGAESLT